MVKLSVAIKQNYIPFLHELDKHEASVPEGGGGSVQPLLKTRLLLEAALLLLLFFSKEDVFTAGLQHCVFEIRASSVTEGNRDSC